MSAQNLISLTVPGPLVRTWSQIKPGFKLSKLKFSLS